MKLQVEREVLVKLSMSLVAEGGMRNVAYQEKVLLYLCAEALCWRWGAVAHPEQDRLLRACLNTLAHRVL